MTGPVIGPLVLLIHNEEDNQEDEDDDDCGSSSPEGSPIELHQGGAVSGLVEDAVVICLSVFGSLGLL